MARKNRSQAAAKKNSAGCLGVIAMVFLGIAGVLAFNTWSFINRAVVTEAIVIDVEVFDDDEGVTYRPVFGFPTGNGPVEASPKVATGEYDYEIGETVEIRYDPDDPTHAIPTGAAGPWIFVMISGGFGAIVAAVAVLTFVSALKSKTRSGK
ncbi:MAG: DUF3592 domain-containing protein [Planctomycetota bacterium]